MRLKPPKPPKIVKRSGPSPLRELYTPEFLREYRRLLAQEFRKVEGTKGTKGTK